MAAIRIDTMTTWIGMNKTDGTQLTDLQHLRQSITDILFTHIGSRIERREYGSRLSELIDHPINAKTRMEIMAATAEALRRWEPRIRLTKVDLIVDIDSANAGRATLELTAIVLYAPYVGRTATATIPIFAAAP